MKKEPNKPLVPKRFFKDYIASQFTTINSQKKMQA
jgi:hypothetical protein